MSDSTAIEAESKGKPGLQFEEREIDLAIGERVRLPSIRVERMNLFHGSPVPGITEFKEAEETTIGSGLYLTSQENAARGYATVRVTDKGLTTPPIVYETEIADMNILTLTTKTAVMDFMKYFRQELFRYKRDELPKKGLPENNFMWYDAGLSITNNILIEGIKANRALPLKNFLFNCGDAAREILMREGYDGLMGLEGGEYGKNPFTGESFQIGDHDSYVIFQPEKVKVISETPHQVN